MAQVPRAGRMKAETQKHTPGPWIPDEDHIFIMGPQGEMIAEMRGEGAELPIEGNARLIASAPDHALIASALCSGMIRWEAKTKEICLNGLRHSTDLDEFGVPTLHPGLRNQIRNAMEATR